MKKSLVVFGLILIAQVSFSQPGPLAPNPLGSSEWEATGFNNGRRMVRDSNGYFHAVWHSRSNGALPPIGTGCHIFYAYTNQPAAEPPSMAFQNAWSIPVNMTQSLGYSDNRYPSIAIETDDDNGAWTTTNTMHIVWQAIPGGQSRYEVFYQRILLTSGQNVPPLAPSPWMIAHNLSQTMDTDSLVPAIAINANNHLHVVWQEEDINGMAPPQEDAWFSDIAYIRSMDGGISWVGPAGGWFGNSWDNITQTAANSQMPSISCILDRWTGMVGPGQQDFGYLSNQVHVAYNEDVGPGIHVFYKRSMNDGQNWGAPLDVTLNTGGISTTFDAYPNIAVDMLDNAHVAWMRYDMVQREPMRTGMNQYQPGIDPTLWHSFPGPEIGMYCMRLNVVHYAFIVNGLVSAWNDFGGATDQEFPTVGLDRWQHVNVNWQETDCPWDPLTSFYEVMRITNLNLNAPIHPPMQPNYIGWGAPINDSKDSAHDDLFPNLAHKKVSMYQSGPLLEPQQAGYDEVWTKINGRGPDAAKSGGHSIFQDGNMNWDQGLPVEIWERY